MVFRDRFKKVLRRHVGYTFVLDGSKLKKQPLSWSYHDASLFSFIYFWVIIKHFFY